MLLAPLAAPAKSPRVADHLKIAHQVVGRDLAVRLTPSHLTRAAAHGAAGRVDLSTGRARAIAEGMAHSPESLYQQLGHLIAGTPTVPHEGPLPPEVLQWLGRAYALVSIVAGPRAAIELRTEINEFHGMFRPVHMQKISAVLYRALAVAELKAPAAAQGAFIPAGNVFDAVIVVGKVIAAAKQRLLIVDPYMDEKALIDFAVLAPAAVSVHLLADQAHHKPSLRPTVARWIAQYGPSRPMEAKLAAARTLHDRLIAVDDAQVWTLTQSLNAFATRSPATIVRVDPETAALKIAAYEAMWAAAVPL